MLQSDFGGIYFKSPSNIFKPKTTEELSEIQSSLYQKRISWVIRNTGHSVNGQTLTNGFQINLSELKKLEFDPQKMRITVGAGNTWMEVFTHLGFPKNSLPVFPNNPGQKIQIGGTVGVGGIGPYSFKYGGLWNWIEKITLVLPTGQIIQASENENPELFRFSIAGFGKIGTISEITFKVIPSEHKVAMLEIVNFSDHRLFSVLPLILKNPKIVGTNIIFKGGKLLHSLDPHALIMIFESSNMLVELEEMKKKLGAAPFKFIIKEQRPEYFNFSFKYHEINKKTIFEYYPIDLRRNHLEGIHPWSDYIFDYQNLQKFLPILRDVVEHYDLEKFIITQTFMKNLFRINMVPTYICKNYQKKLPLVPEVESDYSYTVGLMPTIPESHLQSCLEAIKILTKETYKLRGKRYLYGVHHLTEEDLVNQYGNETVLKWREIKKAVDPLNLQNPHVIFQ